MVELKDFVAETLNQVIDGIASAQEYAKGKKAYINPVGLWRDKDSLYVNPDNPEQFPIPQLIEFDVAVTASEGVEAKAGVGVFASAIGVGTQAKLEDSNLKVSRIKFSIPVQFPQQPS